MSDSRLNSVHLDAARREEFRRAREALINSVGDQTRKASEIKQALADAASEDSLTMSHQLSIRIPPGLDFVLMDKENVYSLKIGLNTIGRLTDNDVVIPDPYLSRRHGAILVHSDGRCEIHDVASKNGTFLNGKKINGPTPLKTGDELRMCDHQFVFARRSELPSAGESQGDHTILD